MEPNQNIIHVCKDCSDNRRKKFQKNLSIADLLMADMMAKRGEAVYIKAVFSKEQNKIYNPEIDRHFYVNNFSEDYSGRTEHMWLICGDVNIEERTVCGILSNDPVIVTDLKDKDIVIVRFEDIEDIDFNLYH